MAGIRISLIEDVSSFLRGMTRSEEALDDVADSLDDLARDAQREGRDIGQGIERGVEQGTDGATDSVERLERTFRDMAREVSRTSRTAGDDVGDNMRDGYREAERAARSFEDTADDASDSASEATGEFRDEARANFSEVASSFSGDMSSAADLVQGTLGGLAGSLVGPAGLAAGALANIGGTLQSSVQENAEKAEQRVKDMYADFLESGADYLSKEYVADQIAKIYEGAEDAAIKINDLRKLAKDSDIPEPLLARALVGDKAARDEVAREISAKRLAITSALDDATAKGQNMAPVYAPAIQALQDVEDSMNGVSENAKLAQRNAEQAAAAIRGIDASRAAASAEDARAKFDGLGRQISTLPASASVKVTADTTALDRELAKPRTVRVNVAPAGGMRVV